RGAEPPRRDRGASSAGAGSRGRAHQGNAANNPRPAIIRRVLPALRSTACGCEAIIRVGSAETHSPSRGRAMIRAVAAAIVVALLPCAGQAQSWFTPGPTLGGFYVGVESGTTWFLNNNGYSMNT